MNSTSIISALIRISCACLVILILSFASLPQTTAGTLVVNNRNGSGSYPASDINITAQYKDAPRWLDVMTHFPNAHIGGSSSYLTGQTDVLFVSLIRLRLDHS